LRRNSPGDLIAACHSQKDSDNENVSKDRKLFVLPDWVKWKVEVIATLKKLYQIEEL
jgi:uncharacterized protein YwgA